MRPPRPELSPTTNPVAISPLKMIDCLLSRPALLNPLANEPDDDDGGGGGGGGGTLVLPRVLE